MFRPNRSIVLAGVAAAAALGGGGAALAASQRVSGSSSTGTSPANTAQSNSDHCDHDRSSDSTDT